jgi:hypothetical protein
VAVLEWGDPDEPQGSETRNALGIPLVIVRGGLPNDVRVAHSQSKIATTVSSEVVEAHNVVAVLPGSDPSLRDEYVIIVERDGERLRLNIKLGELR